MVGVAFRVDSKLIICSRQECDLNKLNSNARAQYGSVRFGVNIVEIGLCSVEVRCVMWCGVMSTGNVKSGIRNRYSAPQNSK